jgi:hypothetical protein
MPIMAYTKDPWQTSLLRYAWTTPSVPPSSYFNMDPVTAAITVSAAGASSPTALMFVPYLNYTMNVTVTDANNMKSQAVVYIFINEINVAATITGLYHVGA